MAICKKHAANVSEKSQLPHQIGGYHTVTVCDSVRWRRCQIQDNQAAGTSVNATLLLQLLRFVLNISRIEKFGSVARAVSKSPDVLMDASALQDLTAADDIYDKFLAIRMVWCRCLASCDRPLGTTNLSQIMFSLFWSCIE